MWCVREGFSRLFVCRFSCLLRFLHLSSLPGHAGIIFFIIILFEGAVALQERGGGGNVKLNLRRFSDGGRRQSGDFCLASSNRCSSALYLELRAAGRVGDRFNRWQLYLCHSLYHEGWSATSALKPRWMGPDSPRLTLALCWCTSADLRGVPLVCTGIPRRRRINLLLCEYILIRYSRRVLFKVPGNCLNIKFFTCRCLNRTCRKAEGLTGGFYWFFSSSAL